MKKNIKDIAVGDRFYCLRESGNEYEGTVTVVRVMKNRETMVTFLYADHTDEGVSIRYRSIYPCDCVEWSAEKPEPVCG
jgi:hypothetical protein